MNSISFGQRIDHPGESSTIEILASLPVLLQMSSDGATWIEAGTLSLGQSTSLGFDPAQPFQVRAVTVLDTLSL